MERKSFLIVAKELLTDKRISATAKLLLAQLQDHRNKQTGQCNPSRQKLTEELGVPLHTIKRALIELRKFGFIQSKQVRYSNNYEIQVAQCEPPKTRGGANSAAYVAQCEPPSTRVSLLTEPYPCEPKNHAVPPTVVELREGPAAAAADGFSIESKPDTQEPEALARELSALHPQPGLARKAVGEVRKAMARGWTAEAIRDRHTEWREYWATLPAGKFIPQLWRWFADGDFEACPVIRKPAVVESYVERMRRQFREA
jgi:hypothetical protein